jgi:hypothetical protein
LIFSSVFGNIRDGHSIIPFGNNKTTFGIFIIPYGVDRITDGDFNISFGFDIITAILNKTAFGFYIFLFGGYKAPFGIKYILGRHSNIGQTPFRRLQLLFNDGAALNKLSQAENKALGVGTQNHQHRSQPAPTASFAPRFQANSLSNSNQ